MLSVATNNPILKNVQLKALRNEKKSQRIPSSLQSQNSPLHLSSHVLPQGKMALGE